MDSTTATTYEGRHRPKILRNGLEAVVLSILTGEARDDVAYEDGYDYQPRHSAAHREALPKGFSAFKVVDRGVQSGVEWMTYEAPLYGAINGYAQLPEGHPWRDLDLQSSDYDKGPVVHGGVTFGPTDEGWIGFDTLHAGDNWPESPRYGAQTSWDREWTAADVSLEAASLARQIAEAQA